MLIPKVDKETLKEYKVVSNKGCLVRNNTDRCYSSSYFGCSGINCLECFFNASNSTTSEVEKYLKQIEGGISLLLII